MKKVYTILVALLALVQFSSAQNTYPWPSTGSIGIGTTSPIGKLTVDDGGTGNNLSEMFTLKTTYGGTSARKAFTWRDGSNITGQIDTYYDGAMTNMSFGHLYNNGYKTSDIMTILGNGYVGIGKTNPSSKLDILFADGSLSNKVWTRGVLSEYYGVGAYAGKGNVILVAEGTQSAPTSVEVNNISNVGAQPLFYDGSVWRVGASVDAIVTGVTANTSVSSGLRFLTGTVTGNASTGGFNGYTEKMRIDATGNVGIGTNSPLAKVDIRADVTSGNVITMQAWNWTQSPTNWGLRLDEYHTGSAIDHRFVQNINGIDANVMTFHSGFVGIGTTAPKEALSVNGNIRSKQVKVETNNWPDYVFTPTYTLPSLKDVKTYIDKYQRLPEMPSEKEVAKNGVNLGEIVKLQTKKIEELTLYAIDQQKQIEQLKQEQQKNKELMVRIDALEKALIKLTGGKQ